MIFFSGGAERVPENSYSFYSNCPHPLERGGGRNPQSQETQWHMQYRTVLWQNLSIYLSIY